MLIFLYGEDFFRSSQKIIEIKQKFLTQDTVGSGLSVFDFEIARGDESWQKKRSINGELLGVLGTPNLLASKRLVIIKNLLLAGSDLQQKELLEYLRRNKTIIQDSDLVVIFWEKNQPKKSNAIFGFLEKNAKRQKFEKLAGIKINQWALARIKEFDSRAEITKTALDKLVVFTAGETILLDKEIQKLVNYVANRGITEADVELLVKANVNSNIFQTIDMLASGNKREALKLLHRNLENGDDPLYILSMFVYQFRNLLKVADLQENQNVREYEIAKIAKLHPFVVKKSLGQIRNFSREKLKKIYQKLMDMDSMAKTGKIKIKLALDKFIIEL